MPDLKSYVREHLAQLDASGAREAEIVEELALEFQQRYERLLLNGSTPEDAWQEIVQSTKPWDELAEELQSEIRDDIPMSPVPERTRKNALLRTLGDVR